MPTWPNCGIADCVCEDPLERTDKLNASAILTWLAAMGCEPRLSADGRLVLNKAAREALSPGAKELVKLTWRRISSCARRKGGHPSRLDLAAVEAVFAMAGVLDLRLRLKAAEYAAVSQRESTPSP